MTIIEKNNIEIFLLSIEDPKNLSVPEVITISCER